MTEKYSCILRLKTSPKNFEHVLDKALDSLPYEPNSVYCFFNEFKRPPDKEIAFYRLSDQLEFLLLIQSE